MSNYSSTQATGTPYDAVSLATTINTGITQMSQSKAGSARSIPVFAPTSFQVQQRPIHVDVASAHQQYHQQNHESEISPSSGSTVSSSEVSSTSAATSGYQQQNNINLLGNNSNSVSYAATGGQSQQQAQFQSNFSMPPISDQFYGSDESRDLMLHIDYGAIEAYNAAFQSSDNFDTVAAPANQAQFNLAKAIFNQVDSNRDGFISRDEFRQWAQGAPQNYGEQSFNQSFSNPYQTQAASNFVQSSVVSGAAGGSSDISNILQQSGLGQAVSHLR